MDEPPETFKNISCGHLFYNPSREGLGVTNRSELEALLRNWEKESKENVLSWLDRFYKLNTFEISIPVLKDPDAAPEGKTGLVVSTLFEYDLVKRVEESGWYDEFKEEAEKKIIEVLSDSIYPFLKSKIIFKLSTTPLSIERITGSSDGSIVGWSFEKPAPVVSDMLKVNDSVKTAIPNVFQAGKWTYSPSGVPMCILTGKLAADKVLRSKKVKSK